MESHSVKLLDAIKDELLNKRNYNSLVHEVRSLPNDEISLIYLKIRLKFHTLDLDIENMVENFITEFNNSLAPCSFDDYAYQKIDVNPYPKFAYPVTFYRTGRGDTLQITNTYNEYITITAIGSGQYE